MKILTLPDYVNTAVRRLEACGFLCYAVGGCVRDALTGKEPHDYDLTTLATPEEMLSVFEGFHIIPTGIKHGTLTVVVDGKPLEITTFRTDGVYEDNRRPKSVNFSKRLDDDLSRRDFTVNAMAYSENDGFVDRFGGISDLESKIIRCVGDPDLRFNEDGLRIMRALRFAAVLGFTLEESTSEAVHRNRRLLENIAAERLWVEFTKLLCGQNATAILREYSDVVGVFIPELLPTVGFDQRTKYHSLDVFEHTLAVIDGCPQTDLCLRLAAFFHDLGKPPCFSLDETGGHFYGHAEKSAEITETVLLRLKTDNATRQCVTRLVAEHCRQIEPTEKAVRRLLATHSETDARRTVALGKADRLACAPDNRDTSNYDGILSIIDRIVSEQNCLSLKTLAVHGGDLIKLGFSGKQIGEMLDFLLGEVLDGNLQNEKSALLDAARRKSDINC